LKTTQVKKGQILQQKGDTQTKVYIVKTGLLRSYTIDSKGKEHIYMFAPEDWIISDSCQPQDSCELFIDALEDSALEVIEKEVALKNANIKAIARRLQTLQNRIVMLMSSTALERYEHFIATYPDIIQRVPQRMVASYLGITPEALSRVRKALFQK